MNKFKLQTMNILTLELETYSHVLTFDFEINKCRLQLKGFLTPWKAGILQVRTS